MELSTLPDDVIVRIGTFVAKLHGVKDYVSLSKTSKRFHRLLMDAESTIPEVIRIVTSASVNKLCLTSDASPQTAVRSLEQLFLFETIENMNLLQDNRIYGKHGDPIDYAPMGHLVSNPNRTSHMDGIQVKLANQQTISLIQQVQTILKKYPSAEVILESHSGTETPTGISDMFSIYRGDVVRDAMNIGAEELLSRYTVRGNGTKFAQRAAASNHPYGELARQGLGWVEVYLRLPYLDDDDSGGALELPPRPVYYEGTAYVDRHK